MLLALLVAALPAVAPAAAPAQGLLVAPTRIAAEVRPGDRLPPIVLTNRTSDTLTVRVDVAPAGQELSGLPDYDLSPESLRRGRNLARPSVRQLRLGPGASRRVSVRVGRPAAGRVGVFGVVAFTARVAEATSKGGSVLTPTLRLTTNLLLRYPGRLRLTGSARALRVEQGPERAGRRTLRFLTRVANDGNLQVRPSVRLTVRARDGAVVARSAFRPENVLPGAERELPFDLAKLLPAGDYGARVAARVGRRSSVRKTQFRLVGPNELPTPRLEISSLRPPDPDAGERFQVRVGVRNTGTAPSSAQGGVALTRPGGGRPLAGDRFDVTALAPGRSSSATVELPGVAEGSYALVARLRDGGRVLSERTVVFSTGTRPGLGTRILDWLAAHLPAVLAGLGVALLIGIAAVLAYVRRLRAAARTTI